MAETVLGIFSNRELAENAINELQKIGLNVKDMSIIMREGEERNRLEANTGAQVGTKVATGAATGAVLGGIAGILIGVGAIAIPGIGALLVGGPLAAAMGLTGIAATTAEGVVAGALTGGIVGGLVSIGVPEERAKTYEERVKHGGILLAVPTLEGQVDDAQVILQKNGATDIQIIALPRVRSDSALTEAEARDEEHPYKPGYHSAQHAQGDTLDVQKYLRHVDYPATKNDLLEVAEEEGAKAEVIHTLEDLPNKEFENSGQVEQAIRRLH
jgi:uncharacterized membrane protein